MIYKVSKTPLFEDNPGLKSNEVFSECTERELRYIFLLYDIESPYIKMGFEDRKEKAALQAGYRKETGGKRFDKNARHVLDGKSRRVNAAIQEFKSIQRSANTNFAVLAALQAHIDRNIKFLEDSDDVSVTDMVKLNKMAVDLEGLIQTKVNIERILDIDGSLNDDIEEEVVGNVSMLDQYNVERDNQ